MSDIARHFADQAGRGLSLDNARLRALINAHEFGSALALTQGMPSSALAETNGQGQTVLHLLAAEVECEAGKVLLRTIIERVPHAMITLQDTSRFKRSAADWAFYADHTGYKIILQTAQHCPMHRVETRSNPSGPA